MTHPIIEALQVNEAQFVALRRRFHQQPEIGFEEQKPAKRLPACSANGAIRFTAVWRAPAWSVLYASARVKNGWGYGRIWTRCRCRR